MSKYKINNIEYPSVTTILGLLDKSPALIGWSTGCMEKYIVQKHTEFNSIEELAKSARFNYKEVSKDALNIGSKVHELIEIYIKHDKDISFQKLKDECENSFLAFLDWEEEHVDEWLESEKEVVNIDVGYAGTLDAKFKHKNGKIYILDFKTSKAIYPEYELQISAYFNANKVDAECYGILRLDKETGLPEWVDYSKKKNFTLFDRRNFDTFRKLTEVYYLLKNRRLKNNPFVNEIKYKYSKSEVFI